MLARMSSAGLKQASDSVASRSSSSAVRLVRVHRSVMGDIRVPVVAAPMAGASGGALAAAVSNSGGFGLVAAGYDAEQFLREVRLAKESLNSVSPGFGVGFLVWQLESVDAAVAESSIMRALEYGPKAVWFAFGADIGRWIEFVRSKSPKVEIFVQVSNVEEAKRAISEWKVDVLVAQGIEAGGHGHSQSPPLRALIESITKIMPVDGPVLLGAGGIVTGAHVASLLSLGASGTVLGTRFLATQESLYTPLQKKVLVNAETESTVRTIAFDHVRGTLGWPEGIDGRAVMNDTVREFEEGVELDQVKARFDTKDERRMLVWAGTGVGRIRGVQSAADVVGELEKEINEARVKK